MTVRLCATTKLFGDVRVLYAGDLNGRPYFLPAKKEKRMKKKLLTLLIAGAMLTAAGAFGIAGCSEKPNESGNGGNPNDNQDTTNHTHEYTQEHVSSYYLATPADCRHKATYYKSCACGEKGMTTFEYGEPNGHTFTQEQAEEKYLKSEATCTAKAVYYKSCSICGEKGIETFEYGSYGSHNYAQKKVEEKYLKSEATCTTKAVYYMSCICGKKGTTTFESGDFSHNFTQEIAENTYLKSPADCTHKASYFKSCANCGEKSTETFEIGEPLGHNFDNWEEVTAPTCTSDGHEKRKCKNDNNHIETRVIDALGHIFKNGLCERCDEQQPDSEGLEFLVNSEGTAYNVVGIGGYKNSYIKIPSQYNGLPVNKIADEAFKDNVDIRSVVIPNSVTIIGHSAFSGCAGLKNVSIGESVKTIENYAFYGTKALKEIFFNAIECDDFKTGTIYGTIDEAKELVNFSFALAGTNNSGITMYVGNKVKKIPKGMFCSYYNGTSSSGAWSWTLNINLSNVVFEDNSQCSTIGDYAFYSCGTLKNVIINGAIAFNSTCFSGCNLNYSECDNCYYLGNEKNPYEILMKANTSLESVVIPDSVTSICGGAFSGCSGLTSVTIPDSVMCIGGYAFYNCNAVTIYCEVAEQPSGWDSDWRMKDLNNSIFSIVWNYKENDIAIDGNIYVVLNGVRYAVKDNNASVVVQSSLITEATISKAINYSEEVYNVTKIVNRAFYKCKGLISINIPDSVKSIDAYTFSGCSGLINVTIGHEITSIGEHAFDGCSGLTNITIPDSVTSIGEHAFRSCNKIIQTENGVKYIDNWVIGCDVSVTEVTLRSDIKGIANSAFSGCDRLTTVNWDAINCAFAGSFSCPIFKDCSKLTAISIGNEVKNIPAYAFNGCTEFTNLIIPDNVTEIGRYAFYNCSGLTSVTISASITTLSDSVFRNCRGLTSVSIPDNVTSVGDSAFSGCSAFKNIAIPNSVTSIGSWAFDNCSKLTSVTIGNSVTSIGGYAFRGCSKLENITIPDSVTSIGNYTFSGCTSLTNIMFKGTKSQWKSFEKGTDWNYNSSNFTIQCTDGNLSKYGNEIE